MNGGRKLETTLISYIYISLEIEAYAILLFNFILIYIIQQKYNFFSINKPRQFYIRFQF